ncbi:copper chaperone PCu(A)C [Streptomonospora nanhaiensis]|uniref:copper chaperone PCu(A)C n=1 Tax=Streptomonospora nanhaiensis TaxID=1323731 RepID=UPI001C37F452|nr:copper chaperone PCu(A)C [Streptomonospora nanhaiensis]MBV2363310.1 copper chaperone PCu(A)C [Streptomonospora nanhaiensis]MBX9390755.1 copper chaperone PCu(A)C [Streptomonospora nanhaiensis]
MASPMRTLLFAAACLAAGAALTGCGGTGAAAAPEASPPAQAQAVTVEDAWVKAVPAEDGMTALFGVLVNDAGQEAHLVAASTSVAGTVELHEVVTGEDGTPVMRPKEGGFVIGADGRHPLEPGADHIMLMELGEDLEPGEEVEVELEFADGSTTEVSAPVKDFAGGEENYEGGGSGGGAHGHGETDGAEDHG